MHYRIVSASMMHLPIVSLSYFDQFHAHAPFDSKYYVSEFLFIFSEHYKKNGKDILPS